MDITLPIATGFGVIIAAISGGVSWGIVKVTTSKNSKEISVLRKEVVTNTQFTTFRDGCQALLLAKIEEVNKSHKEFKREIKENLESYDDKRDQARIESQKTLDEINRFIGRVDEYIRLKNGNGK